MLRTITLIALAVAASAQIPPQDSRNTNTPNTDTKAALPEFHSLQDWEQRKAQLREQILTAAGLYPLPPHPVPHAEIFGRLDRDGYTIEKVLIETLPGYYLGGNLYRPKNSAAKHPGILNAHGHWTYGRLENSENFSGPLLGINLARQGYVVFAYDMVGYNDTLQTPHKFGSPKEQLYSFGPLQLQLWNSIRALDFISSLPDVDPSKLGITGASGGGTQTFLLAAVDDRLSFAAPVNMVSAIMQGGDFCENAPGLRIGTNNVEIAAMFAPKPMLLVSATGDWTKNVPHEEFPAIQRIYDLYGKRDNVSVIQIDAPHNYNQLSREGVYRFFAKQILGRSDAGSITEPELPVEYLQDMLALANRTLPANAASYDQIFKEWQSLGGNAPLQLTLHSEWPAQVVSEKTATGIVLSRLSVGDRIPAVLIEGHGSPVLVVDPNGSESARHTPEIAELIKQKHRILLIDAFQTGSAVAPRDRSHEHFLTFNLSDDACRVQDILTALSYLSQSNNTQSIELIGLGNAAIWTKYAASVAPIHIELHADLSNFHGTDDDFLRAFNVPGIKRTEPQP